MLGGPYQPLRWPLNPDILKAKFCSFFVWLQHLNRLRRLIVSRRAPLPASIKVAVAAIALLFLQLSVHSSSLLVHANPSVLSGFRYRDYRDRTNLPEKSISPFLQSGESPFLQASARQKPVSKRPAHFSLCNHFAVKCLALLFVVTRTVLGPHPLIPRLGLLKNLDCLT